MSVEQNVNDRMNERRASGIERIQTSMHLGMGVVYLIMGCIIIYMQAFGGLALDGPWPYLIGGLMLLYGFFRLWRGFVGMKVKRRYES